MCRSTSLKSLKNVTNKRTNIPTWLYVHGSILLLNSKKQSSQITNQSPKLKWNP